MARDEELDPKKPKENARLLILLFVSVLIVSLGIYIYFYWLRETSFPWQDWFSKGEDYRAVTDLTATQEADSMVTALEENVEEGESTEESDNFSPLAYGDVVYSYGDDDELVLGNFTIKGVYLGYNASNKQIIIQLEGAEDTLAFSREDVTTMYYFTSDVTKDIEVSSGGVAVPPNSNLPFSEEARQNFKIENSQDVPKSTVVLVYGQIDYTQDKNIIYDAVEFYAI